MQEQQTLEKSAARLLIAPAIVVLTLFVILNLIALI